MQYQLIRKFCAPLFCLAAAITAGCATVEADTRSAVVRLDIAPCEESFDGVEADCGQMLVYENRQTKSGRIIPINFIRVRAKTDRPAADAVFALTGGPGQGATGAPANAIAALRSLDARDLVLVDQRGTGGSNPLDCIHYDLENDPGAFQEMFETAYFGADRFRECMERLNEVADLTQYTTSMIADDINDLRDALGYEQMMLAGGSYGSTLGLEIIRRHGGYVRAAVFRGVIPQWINQTETLAKDMEDALQRLIDDCAADGARNAAFPDFEKDLHVVLGRFAEGPVAVELPHPMTNEKTKVLVGYDELATAIRYTLYSTQFSAELPLAISNAKDGDYARLTQLLPTVLLGLSNTVSEGMWASVRCAEEFPALDEARARKLAEGTVLGVQRIDSGLAICAFWPRGAAAADFHQPFSSDVPVLMIDGGVDAATPPWMAQEIVERFSNLKLVIVPNRSHYGLGGGCIEDFVDTFVNTADAHAVDDACVKDFERPPFVLPGD